MSENRLAEGAAVGVVPPLPLTTYTATWTAKGKDAFWPLMGAFTTGLIQGSCNLIGFSYDETDDSASVTFTVRAGVPHIAMLNKDTPEGIEKTAITLGKAEWFDLGADLRPRTFKHTVYMQGGENPRREALACWMTAMVASECRLLFVDAGGGRDGCYFDFTIGGTRSQLDISQTIIANYGIGG